MSDDIKLPPLPLALNSPLIARHTQDYARAAVEADRQGRMPSDEKLLDLVSRLRALSRYQHDDMSVADEAADALMLGQSAAGSEPFMYVWMADDGEHIRYWTRDPAQAARREVDFGKPPMRLFAIAVASPAGSPAISAGFGTFSSDDRFWHAADCTWWRRGDDGMLVRAEAPQPAASAEVDAWIDAANSYADKYNGDDRQDIKTDVMNAFYQGAQWMRIRSQPAASAEPHRCEDCPPVGYPTDKTRCAPCDRRADHLVCGRSNGDGTYEAVPAASAEPVADYDPLEGTGDGGPHEARLMAQRAPVAQGPTTTVEPSVLLDALSGLVNALRERHYGRMPDEVQAAYDKAWAIVFSSPVAAQAQPDDQEDAAPITVPDRGSQENDRQVVYNKGWNDCRAAILDATHDQPIRTEGEDAPACMSNDVFRALCFCLWHHQGGSSRIGQPIRSMLGLRKYDNMTVEQVDVAKAVQSALSPAKDVQP